MRTFLFSVLMSLSLLSLHAQNTIGTIYNSLDAEDGYVLFEYMGDTSIYLIDNCGQVVNQWASNFNAGTSVYLLEDGSIVRSGRSSDVFFNVAGKGGILERIDWNGNLVWQYVYSSALATLHHDIAVMPNGNILAIAYELRTKQEAIDAGRDSTLISENELWPEKIIEFQPSGTNGATIVWEWRMWDHLIQDFDSTKANYGVIKEHPELFNINFMNAPVADWGHANSIDYNADLDQIVLSLNAFNEFVIIDHSTTTLQAATHSGGVRGKGGDILYRYGNPQSYSHGDETNRVNYKQHNVQWIASGLNDAGKIMYYNNGNNRPEGDYSSVEIITPLTNLNGDYLLEADTTFAPDSAEWIYTAPVPTDFFSPNISGAQRLPNGNTLICQGRDGRLFEINVNKEIVWEYRSPINNLGIMTQGVTPSGNRNVFRALRYLPSFPGFVGKDLTPGAPIEINPNLNECLSVGSIEIDKESTLTVYPNPVQYQLTVTSVEGTEMVQILDVFGRIVYDEDCSGSIDVSAFEPGIYLMMLGTKQVRFVKQ